MNERYARQIMLPDFGEEGQRRLQQSAALLVGAGGLGCTIAPLLCAAGIGKLVIADGDKVSLSNLQRQILYRTDQTGLPKVECARETLRRLNPEVKIEIHNTFFTAGNAQRLVSGTDIILDGTDNAAARYLIDDTSRHLAIPYVYGSIREYQGQVAVFNLTPQSASYRDLYPEPCGNRAEPAAVIGTLPCVVGSLQAHEALKILCGCGKPLDSRLLLIDIRNQEFKKVTITPSK